MADVSSVDPSHFAPKSLTKRTSAARSALVRAVVPPVAVTTAVERTGDPVKFGDPEKFPDRAPPPFREVVLPNTTGFGLDVPLRYDVHVDKLLVSGPVAVTGLVERLAFGGTVPLLPMKDAISFAVAYV